GGATLIHCHASLSRSVAFILAYLMKTKALTALEAVEFMKPKWDAVWPNDKFVLQLIEYEQEL
ncbi:dual specificity phosphatase, partial [Ochromonadaceae sp. CCMP2298]